MRRYIVTWQTFAAAVPLRGQKIVVEQSSSATKQGRGRYPHRSACVTGKYEPGGNYKTNVLIIRKNGNCAWVKKSDRWYLAGTERLEDVCLS